MSDYILPHGVNGIDFDEDGDIDVISSSYSASTIDWFENNGDGTFIKHTLISGFNGAVNVISVDLNKDNNIDLVAIAQISGKLSYFLNEGDNIYSETILSNDFGGPGLMIQDHNLDGHLDILACAGRQDEISLWSSQRVLRFKF